MRIALVIVMLATGCASTPVDPPAAVWVPEIGDLVSTHYCPTCPDMTGEEIHGWLTDVRRDPHTGWMVYMDEFQVWISASLVKPLWPDDPPPLPQ